MQLRTFAAEFGLDAETLAARLNCDQSHVQLWLDGAQRPDPALIEKIASLSGGRVTAADFAVAPPAPGMAEFQDGIAILRQVSISGILPDRQLAASRRREARDWARIHRDYIDMWNVWLARSGLPLDGSNG